MQIDKTQNVQVQGFLEGIAQKESSVKSAAKPIPDVKIDVNYQEYVEKVVEFDATDDTDKIAEARKLIASGALDTPEAARKAAENLLRFGI